MGSARTRDGYTVHEVARLAGVTVRTLHHYDRIGLVCPQRSDNGYRSYGAEELERLQQVLLYRELDMSLAEVRGILDSPAFDSVAALEAHKQALVARRDRCDALIASVQKTIDSKRKGTPMSDSEKFEAFKKKAIAENEQRFGAEVRERWGDAAMDASNEKAAAMTEDAYNAAKDLEAQIKEQLLAAMHEGSVDGQAAKRLVQMHKQWICGHWPEGAYSPEAHKGLADGYVADPRFAKYYDEIAEGAARFLRDAIHAHA